MFAKHIVKVYNIFSKKFVDGKQKKSKLIYFNRLKKKI